MPYEFILPGFRHLSIGWRKFAELGDGGGDHVQCEIDVGGIGVTGENEAQAGTYVFGLLENGD